MAEQKSVMATRIGDIYANLDAGQFAVVPDLDGAVSAVDNLDHDDTSSISNGLPNWDWHDYLDSLVASAVAEPAGLKRQLAVIEEIFPFRGRVLWPLGLFFYHSPLSKIGPVALANKIAQIDPDLAALQEKFKELPAIKRMRTESSRRDYAVNYWKIFVSMKMSFQGIDTLDDVQDLHTRLLVRVLRPEGEWHPCLTQINIKHIRSFVSALAEMRGDPLFGQSVGRIVYSGRRARKISPANNKAHLKWVETQFDTWLDELNLHDKKHHRRALKLLLEVLDDAPSALASEPATAFSGPMVKRLLDHAAEWSTPSLRMQAIGKVFEFATWLSDRSRDDYGKPAFYVALTATDIAAFRRRQPKKLQPTELAARPMPARYHVLLKQIIAENDFAWPKSLIHNYNGLGRLWFTWLDPETGNAQPVFSEVLPRLMLLLLDIPLRTIQARRLDSGEGDEERWDVQSQRWIANTGPFAGHWLKQRAKNIRRGAIRRIAGAGPAGGEVTGLYINSNKTQDASQLFDETSGYEIPWQHDEVIANLDAMRRWQEKYNPVLAPLPRASVPKFVFKDEPSATVRETQPDRFYLFREPLNQGKRGNEAPPTYPALLQFFHDALAELERRLNADDPHSELKIITRRDASGLPKQAIFSMHGMRSSTLTSLYEQGVPIGMLSKLVAGHATILMTLRYVKYEPAHVSHVLTEARQKSMADDALQFRQVLGSSTFAEAARMTARLADDGLQQIHGQYTGPSSWSGMDIGICPNGQTLCHIGGERTRTKRAKDGPDKSTYAPVSGGPRNCVRCRFFVTGMPFLIPLCGHSNAISAKADAVSRRLDSTDDELKELKRRRHELAGESQGVPDEVRRRIQVLEAEWDADHVRRDQYLADFHATLVLIERIRSLSSQTDDGSVPMIVDELGVPEVSGRESTRFELSDAVVQMGRFFPSLASEDMERERDGFLDRVLYNEGYVPFSMSPLDPIERRRAADALAALLLGELGSMETENLIQGRKTLSELGIEQGVDDVVRRTIGKPLDRVRIAANDQVRPRVIEASVGERS